ncbi:methyl-accepting chemotaxis protein, partial [Rhizobium ruizarguesonis]
NGKRAATVEARSRMGGAVAAGGEAKAKAAAGASAEQEKAELRVNQSDDALQAMREQAVNLRGFILFRHADIVGLGKDQ